MPLAIPLPSPPCSPGIQMSSLLLQSVSNALLRSAQEGGDVPMDAAAGAAGGALPMEGAAAPGGAANPGGFDAAAALAAAGQLQLPAHFQDAVAAALVSLHCSCIGKCTVMPAGAAAGSRVCRASCGTDYVFAICMQCTAGGSPQFCRPLPPLPTCPCRATTRCPPLRWTSLCSALSWTCCRLEASHPCPAARRVLPQQRARRRRRLLCTTPHTCRRCLWRLPAWVAAAAAAAAVATWVAPSRPSSQPGLGRAATALQRQTAAWAAAAPSPTADVLFAPSSSLQYLLCPPFFLCVWSSSAFFIPATMHAQLRPLWPRWLLFVGCLPLSCHSYSPCDMPLLLRK